MIKTLELKESITNNDFLKTQALLTDHSINPSFDHNWAIFYAAKYGYADIIELLLNNKNFNFFDENIKWVIGYPSQNGDIETLKAIINIEKFDITDYIICGIISAAENGHSDIVDLLLNDKRINPLLSYAWAFMQAYKLEHHNVVDLLWKKTNVKHCIKKDHIYLYNELTQKYIKNKVNEF